MAIFQEEELADLIPTRDELPLLRGLLIGIAVGATIAGVIILVQTIRHQQERQVPPAADDAGSSSSGGAAPTL